MAGDYNEPFLLPRTYALPELPWEQIAGRLEPITISILRFDARLEASGLSAGWQSRCDMTEAVRALLLDGHLVDVGDLVLHDAGMDVRHPTHELTRAAAALRARRTALARKAPWPLSIDGLTALRGVGSPAEEKPSRSMGKRPDAEEEEAEDLWLDVVKRTSHWPAVAAAALAWYAWLDLNLYTRLPWLGLIMAAAILRARGLTHHLLPLAAGFKQSKFRPQGREGAAEKLEEALAIAHKDLDRLILARELMSRVTAKTRSNSKLPELVALFLSRPLVTGPLAAKLLKVTPKAVDLMLAQLGGALPRELTGRTRYRAWGIV